MVTDFFKVIGANGQAKIVFEETTLTNRFSFNRVHVIGSRLCLVRGN